MSKSKVCEMGNRVVIGANGGYILNLETGAATQFVKKDGIYVFNMWIPHCLSRLLAGLVSFDYHLEPRMRRTR